MFRKFLMKLIIIGLIGLSLVFTAGFFLIEKIMPVDKNATEEITIEIPTGSSGKTIGGILENNGLVNDGDFFYYYARITGDYTNFKAGTFTLMPSMTIAEISKALTQGTKFAETIKMTIPEGYTVKQVAEKLSEAGLVNKKDFLDLANSALFDEMEVLQGVKVNDETKYRLEGLLFPKTYEFEKNATEMEILQTMVNQTLKEIPSEWYDEVEKDGRTMYEAIVLASIIEREVVEPTERAKVAGVYLNRLEDDMRLQADATVQYAFGEQKARLLYEDLKIDSVYNTYKYKGLPPSPIANPGIASIKAAVFPEKHDFLYYVTKKDGTSEHYFSKSYEGHLENIEISKKNQQKNQGE